MTSTGTLEDIRYEERRDGSDLTFTGHFLVAADPERVLSTLFDYDHLTHFMTIPSSIKLLDQGEEWQTLEYGYRAFVFPFRERFRRTLNRADCRIDFELAESLPRLPPLPRLVSYSGHYRVEPREGGCEVQYHQQLSLSPALAAVLLERRVMRDLLSFLSGTRRYLAEVCQPVSD